MGDSLTYQSEKTLKDLGEKVDAALRNDADAKIQVLRGAINGDDVNAITNASNALQEVMQKIGSAAYQQSGPAEGGQPGAGFGGQPDHQQAQPEDNGDDFVEGEFHEA